jgi:hypothetical protein
MRAVQTMAHLIASGGPHAAFIAPPRFGKTSATEYAQRCLSEAFPTLPIYLYISRHTQLPKERNFYTDLLLQLKAGETKKTLSISDCLVKVVRRMFTDAQSRGSREVLLIVDEIQELTESQLSWLMDVGNELQHEGVRMIVISFGQLQLMDVRTALLAQGRGDILGRFLTRCYTFHGIRSAEELCEFMRGYDDPGICDFPESSGLSFTGFFLPHAYKAGWRLAGEALMAWNQFVAAATRCLSQTEIVQLSVGMEWVAATIQHILMHRTDYDSARFRLRPDDWKEAVAMSRFEASLPYVYKTSCVEGWA